MAIRAWRFEYPDYWTAREGDCNIDTLGGGGQPSFEKSLYFYQKK
jgi:hypothetical protein